MSDLSPQEFNQSALQALVNSSQSIHSPMQLVASITGDASLAGLFRAQAVAQGATCAAIVRACVGAC